MQEQIKCSLEEAHTNLTPDMGHRKKDSVTEVSQHILLCKSKLGMLQPQ